MRQAVANAVLGLCLVLAASARGDGPSPGEGPTIARARRLIEAGERAAALGLLEDALIDGPAGDRPAIIDLLRRSYADLAREAEAAGRAEDASHYRDNLAILEQAVTAGRSAPTPPPQPQPARPPAEPSKRPVEPVKPPAEPVKPPAEPAKPTAQPAPGPSTKAAATTAGRPPQPSPASAGIAPTAPSDLPELTAPRPDPGLSEPISLPEPARLPKPGAMPPPAPAASPEATTGIPLTVEPSDGGRAGTREIPPASPEPTDPGDRGGREMTINPGEATEEPAPARPAPADSPGSSRRTEGGQGVSSPARPPAREGPTADRPPALAEADRLFTAQRFEEAGRIYTALAARDRLPADRRPHWAYCRFRGVVRRINVGPRSSREWDAIEAEVREIQQLTPGNWYGEYLISKVAEARRSRRRPGAGADRMVVRGSAPEDAPSENGPLAPAPSRRRPGLLGRSRGAATRPATPAAPAEGRPIAPSGDQSLNLPGGPARPGPDDPSGTGPLLAIAADGDRPISGPASATRAPIAREGDGDGAPPRTGARRREGAEGGVAAGAGEAGGIAWQVHETANFRIHHQDPALAERCAAIAESVRAAQSKRWGSVASRSSWSPRCDVFLYPTARAYAEATGQPEISPGLSTLSNNGVRVVSRRMSLRADNPLLLTATLPHEVTHIVLADLFVAQQIPRWADEGLAVLAEPEAERRRRQADLKGPLDAGRTFEVGRLMTIDFPDPKDWRLFYAQSVSLTLFLVEQGPPERFIQFVRDSQRLGVEAALRDVYHIDGLDALQGRWLAFARERVAVDVASSRDPGSTAGDIRRD